MSSRFATLIGLHVLSLACGPGAFAQSEVALENGLLRVILHRSTGRFEALAVPGGSIRLMDAGPAFETNGAQAALKLSETTRERFNDPLGAGEKLVLHYQEDGHAAGIRYELRLYQNKPWASATAWLGPGDYSVGDFDLLRAKLRVPDAFRTRVYISSGTAGGDSGVWPLGMRRWNSAALSVYYAPQLREAAGVGFYSFARASTSVVSQYLNSGEVGVRATAHYNGYRPRSAELQTESLLLNFGPDPLNMLEQWAEAAVQMVRPRFIRDAQLGLLNTWYIYGAETSQEQTIQQAKLLAASVLPHYGIRSVTTGEWQKQHAEFGDVGDIYGFGESEEDRRRYPQGVGWLCDQIRAVGLLPTFGFNYAYAAAESSTAKTKPEWIVTQDRSRIASGFPIDYTHPEARRWLYDLARRAVAFRAAWVWTDFDGGPTRGTLHDPGKVMGFEDIREGLRTMREALGPKIPIAKACCGPYFTYIGLADRVRTGRDMAPIGDWEGLKDTARQLAATYMLHQRFWIHDPDVIFVGGEEAVYNAGALRIPSDPSILDEVRMRLQYQLATGGFPTIGENLRDLDAEKTRLLTLVLPSYGQAARPVDLFVHTTPEIYDLKVSTAWDNWHVLILQNWNDHQQNYQLRLKDLDLAPEKAYLIFRFWDQVLVDQFRGSASLTVGARKGETFAIRPVPNHPWVLSTDMHLTQGGVDLARVRYDEAASKLEGVARRHPGAQGNVVAYVPRGYRVRFASGDYREDARPSGARAVYLKLRFTSEEVPWWMEFSREQE